LGKSRGVTETETPTRRGKDGSGKHAAREADKLHERLGKPGDKLIDAAKAAAAGSVFGGKN
jgi:hypothetical protein